MGRDGRTLLAYPNLNVQTGAGKILVPLFSFLREGSTTTPGWCLVYWTWWPYTSAILMQDRVVGWVRVEFKLKVRVTMGSCPRPETTMIPGKISHIHVGQINNDFDQKAIESFDCEIYPLVSNAWEDNNRRIGSIRYFSVKQSRGVFLRYGIFPLLALYQWTWSDRHPISQPNLGPVLKGYIGWLVWSQTASMLL